MTPAQLVLPGVPGPVCACGDELAAARPGCCKKCRRERRAEVFRARWHAAHLPAVAAESAASSSSS